MKIGDMLPRDKGTFAFTLAILLIIPLANYALSLFLYWLLSFIGNLVAIVYSIYRYIWIIMLIFDAGLLVVPYSLTRTAAIRSVVLRYIGLSFIVGLVSVITSGYDLLSYDRFRILISILLSILVPAIICYFSFGGYRRIGGSMYYGVMIVALVAISLLTNLANELARMATQARSSQNTILVIVAYRIVATVAALWAARRDERDGRGPYGGVVAPLTR
jgi:hypothetical protein